jgi:hypothetical protein
MAFVPLFNAQIYIIFGKNQQIIYATTIEKVMEIQKKNNFPPLFSFKMGMP